MWSRRPDSGPGGAGSTSGAGRTGVLIDIQAGGRSSTRVAAVTGGKLRGRRRRRTPERRRKGPDRRRLLSGPGVAEAGNHVVPAFLVGAALRCVRLLVIQDGPGLRYGPALAVSGEP